MPQGPVLVTSQTQPPDVKRARSSGLVEPATNRAHAARGEAVIRTLECVNALTRCLVVTLLAVHVKIVKRATLAQIAKLLM